MDPELAALAERQSLDPIPAPSLENIPLFRASLKALTADLPQPQGVWRRDLRAGNIPLRLYRPTESVAGPLLVFLHGGGWMLGDLETHDAACAWLAEEAGYPVLAVEYRLAPEHPFPAGLDDCDAAYSWAIANAQSLGCDPDRVAIGGESAGANLAAGVTLRRAARGEAQPLFQLLVHPATDLRATAPSWREVQVPDLSPEVVSAMCSLYLRSSEDIENPLVSPLLAPSHHGLAPAIILTAECDPLRDDGEFYALALAKAGVETLVQRLPGLPHGFMIRPVTIPAIAAAYNLTGRLLRRYSELG